MPLFVLIRLFFCSILKQIVNTTNENESLDKTSENDSFKSNKEIVESACKLLIQQVLKSCPTINLSSITIKTTASPINKPAVANDTSVNVVNSSSSGNNQTSEAAVETKTIQLKSLVNNTSNQNDNNNNNISNNSSINAKNALNCSMNSTKKQNFLGQTLKRPTQMLTSPSKIIAEKNSFFVL